MRLLPFEYALAMAELNCGLPFARVGESVRDGFAQTNLGVAFQTLTTKAGVETTVHVFGAGGQVVVKAAGDETVNIPRATFNAEGVLFGEANIMMRIPTGVAVTKPDSRTFLRTNDYVLAHAVESVVIVPVDGGKPPISFKDRQFSYSNHDLSFGYAEVPSIRFEQIHKFLKLLNVTDEAARTITSYCLTGAHSPEYLFMAVGREAINWTAALKAAGMGQLSCLTDTGEVAREIHAKAVLATTHVMVTSAMVSMKQLMIDDKIGFVGKPVEWGQLAVMFHRTIEMLNTHFNSVQCHMRIELDQTRQSRDSFIFDAAKRFGSLLDQQIQQEANASREQYANWGMF